MVKWWECLIYCLMVAGFVGVMTWIITCDVKDRKITALRVLLSRTQRWGNDWKSHSTSYKGLAERYRDVLTLILNLPTEKCNGPTTLLVIDDDELGALGRFRSTQADLVFTLRWSKPPHDHPT